MQVKVPDKGFTHSGVFHADDVFSTAFLRILNPNIAITRGRDYQIPENYDGIVYDIGCKCGYPRYDHHQQDNEVRPNGVPYAAFGKLWRDFGPMLFSKKQCDVFDKRFIQPLDLADCTGAKDSLSSAIAAFNPVWDDRGHENARFEEAVQFATTILNKQFEYMKSLERAYDIVQAALDKQKVGIVHLDSFVPWKDIAMQDKNALFVIWPSARGGYNIQGVPVSDADPTLRVPFPQEWLGKQPAELNAYVTGLTFCHPSNFLATADTLEHADVAALTAISQCIIREPDNPHLPWNDLVDMALFNMDSGVVEMLAPPSDDTWQLSQLGKDTNARVVVYPENDKHIVQCIPLYSNDGERLPVFRVPLAKWSSDVYLFIDALSDAPMDYMSGSIVMEDRTRALNLAYTIANIDPYYRATDEFTIDDGDIDDRDYD